MPAEHLQARCQHRHAAGSAGQRLRGRAAERPGIGRPFTLLRVDATGLRDYSQVSTYRLGFRHKENTRTCATEPGAPCDGTVTPAGLAALELRPGGGTPIYTTNREHAQHKLGSYTVERWQWDCTAGACSWLQLPANSGGPSYLQQGSLYYYTSGPVPGLAFFSSEGWDTFHSSSGRDYPCWLWGEDAFVDLDTRTGAGLVSSASIRGHMVCSIAVAGNYHDREMGMSGLSGVMGDRCARLTAREGGPGPGEVIQVLTSSW